MHLYFDGVNDAFTGVVRGIHTGEIPTVRTSSRNGDVLQVVDPVTITYNNPRNRVLFNPARDANPFFHLYESLWMLAGRNDVAPLRYYNSRIGDYSDDGETFNGAYGYRWRHAHNKPEATRVAGEYEGTDQLKVIIDHLKRVPNSRRVVLQMWNVEDDLLKIDGGVCKKCNGTKRGRPKDDYGRPIVDGSYGCPQCSGSGVEAGSKDVCCNLCVMFSLREVPSDAGIGWYHTLDMTVINRSNDTVWGMFGANVVHFSMLQEYVAGMLGVEVGKYHQISNNLHVYTWNWEPEKWLAWDDLLYLDYLAPPLVSNPETFDDECAHIVETFRDGNNRPLKAFTNRFLEEVAVPLFQSWCARKEYKHDKVALGFLAGCSARGWATAAREWIERRMK